MEDETSSFIQFMEPGRYSTKKYNLWDDYQMIRAERIRAVGVDLAYQFIKQKGKAEISKTEWRLMSDSAWKTEAGLRVKNKYDSVEWVDLELWDFVGTNVLRVN